MGCILVQNAWKTPSKNLTKIDAEKVSSNYGKNNEKYVKRQPTIIKETMENLIPREAEKHDKSQIDKMLKHANPS